MKLIKTKIFAQIKVSESFVKSLTVKAGYVTDDFILDQLTFQMVGILKGEDLGECLIKYPKDWLHALLDRFLPQWVKQWVEIKYVRIHARQRVMYPELEEPSLPNERQIYSLTRLE